MRFPLGNFAVFKNMNINTENVFQQFVIYVMANLGYGRRMQRFLNWFVVGFPKLGCLVSPVWLSRSSFKREFDIGLLNSRWKYGILLVFNRMI